MPPFRAVIAFVVVAVACSGCQSTPPATAASKPKLLVFLVVDGLPMRQIIDNRSEFAPDGFSRFLDRGRWLSNAYYGHGFTVTAAGHSTMLTGAYPHRTGIIANEWLDPATGALVYNTADTAYQYVSNTTEPLAGTSPRNLKAETLSDVLLKTREGSKSISISGKDRGAILLAGQLGTAYMFMRTSGTFASSTYYMTHHPVWVDEFNASKPADAYFGKAWTAVQANESPAKSALNDKKCGSNRAIGTTLPVIVASPEGKPDPKFYENFLTSPFGDELTLAFARTAVHSERLGQRQAQDILTVSLSSHDYVNHAFGPESNLSRDHLLQLDRHLQGFFQFLDGEVGPNNYLLVLTADHGFTDTPEWSKSCGIDAGRFNTTAVLASINAALKSEFGVADLARGFSGAGLLLNEELIARRGLDFQSVEKYAAESLRKQAGVEAVFTKSELGGEATSQPLLVAARKSFYPARSARLHVLLKPNWIFSDKVSGSSHGGVYWNDIHVPLLFWGPTFVGRGIIEERSEMINLAPSLAAIEGLRVPAQSEGIDLRIKAN
jgi:predicted AlkP superfamily pyrophosphatase or phosphodiesterase